MKMFLEEVINDNLLPKFIGNKDCVKIFCQNSANYYYENPKFNWDLKDFPVPVPLCRGHFKTFDEKPLFGKHKGMYWWGQTMRGNKDVGEIKKDYEVKI